METLVVSLAVAAISGVTFLAYKHPAGYQKLLEWFKIGAGIIMVAALAVSFGVSRAYFALFPFIDSSKRDEARAAIENIDPYSWRLVGGYVVLIVYLGFLVFLPYFTGRGSGANEKTQSTSPPEVK